jgi:siroheme synthase
VRFLTGHLKDGTTELPWEELVHPAQTLVIYMGLTGLKDISQSLMKFGMKATMPVAIVEKGTTKDQRVFTSTIENIYDVSIKNEAKSPALLIIGEVVTLQKKLEWYGKP